MELFNEFVDRDARNKISLSDDTIRIIMSYIVTYDNYKNVLYEGKREGTRLSYYNNGILFQKLTFRNDMVEGEFREYNYKGQLIELTHYHRGVQHGRYQVWKNNILVIDGYCNHGKHHGKISYYRNTGAIHAVYNYNNDVLNGEHKRYNYAGILMVHCYYLNGELHGEFKSWTNEGKRWKHCNYSHGELSGKYREWDDDGTVHDLVYPKNE